MIDIDVAVLQALEFNKKQNQKAEAAVKAAVPPPAPKISREGDIIRSFE